MGDDFELDPRGSRRGPGSGRTHGSSTNYEVEESEPRGSRGQGSRGVRMLMPPPSNHGRTSAEDSDDRRRRGAVSHGRPSH